MSEKLVVHSGGKLTRKTIQSGLLTSANNGFNSITASASGNYVVSYDGSGYSLVQADAAAAGIDHIDSSFFRTATGNPITVSGNTIPYFTDNDTFNTITLPTTSGSYLIRYDGSKYTCTVVSPYTMFTTLFGLSSDRISLVAYNGPSNKVNGMNFPSNNGNYVLNNTNGTYTWSEQQDAAKQAFCVEMQVQSDSNIFTKPINITSDNYGVFTSINPTQIPTVTIGKTYRLTFHLNGYLQDTAVTENAQYTLTLSGTDVFTVTQTLQDEATNTVRLTFDTIFKPTNAYVSFSITLSSDIGIVLKRFVPCYLVVQEV